VFEEDLMVWGVDLAFDSHESAELSSWNYQPLSYILGSSVYQQVLLHLPGSSGLQDWCFATRPCVGGSVSRVIRRAFEAGGTCCFHINSGVRRANTLFFISLIFLLPNSCRLDVRLEGLLCPAVPQEVRRWHQLLLVLGRWSES